MPLNWDLGAFLELSRDRRGKDSLDMARIDQGQTNGPRAPSDEVVCEDCGVYDPKIGPRGLVARRVRNACEALSRGGANSATITTYTLIG